LREHATGGVGFAPFPQENYFFTGFWQGKLVAEIPPFSRIARVFHARGVGLEELE
jgi:hypothetical protein